MWTASAENRDYSAGHYPAKFSSSSMRRTVPMRAKTSTTKEDHVEAQLDEALTLTFPASDPIAVATNLRGDQIVGDKKEDSPLSARASMRSESR